jgi:hypothetical protein
MEFMLMRFPSQLFSDCGRTINTSEAHCGEAAELHVRWERDLKPQGLPIGARPLDFHGGMPGDVGCSCSGDNRSGRCSGIGSFRGCRLWRSRRYR